MQLNRKTVEIQIAYGSRATLKHKGHNKIDFEMLINISDIVQFVQTITEIQHLFTKKNNLKYYFTKKKKILKLEIQI